MIIRTDLILLFLSWTKVFCENATNITYALDDLTLKGKKIGNLIYAAAKHHTQFENAVLMSYNNLFELKINGDLHTKVDIDRDELCVKLQCCQDSICLLGLKAYLFKGSPTVFNIRISIHDTNDNRPNFNDAQNVITIPESAELYSTYKLPMASDADSKKYGIDSYTISDLTNTFTSTTLNNEPYLKLEKLLDREKLSSYNLQLVAYDKGVPPLSNSLDITVKVSDINDNAPFFVDSQTDFTSAVNVSGYHSIKIKENLSGDVIYHLHAHDIDDGDNAKIVYTISPTQSQPTNVVKQKFSLKSPHETAKIQLRQNLDYEVEEERIISLVIIATDCGKPAKSASISLTILLADENDNAPTIIETMTKDIIENDAKPQQLKIFSVSDRDTVSQNKVRCVLSHESVEKFDLKMYDWNLYGLYNKVAFDFEVNQNEHVRLLCTDSGDPEIKQSTKFHVRIVDQNDNRPQWEKEKYETTLQENDISQRLLITMSAFDADSGAYGAIFYNISSDAGYNSSNFVRIDQSTGNVYAGQPVDREVYDELIYHITATDNRGINPPNHYNTTKLTIKILDENDNSPKFLSQVKHFKITENSAISTVVGHLQFIDVDEPPNNIMTMTLTEYNIHTHISQHTKWFSVTDNFTIVVKTMLNREEISNISLTVNVEDHGRPPRTASEDIIIEILDENDNAPSLWYPKNGTFISSGGVIQTTPLETKLIQLEANDPDNGINSSIKYHIINTNFSIPNILKINKKSGEISTNWHSFDQPDIGVYFLQISINDQGYPAQSTCVILYVNITNTNTTISAEAYMSNIVILILIIVCSLALIVSLIAAIFWVRFRVTGDSSSGYNDENLEREHLNKELNANQYSLMALENNFRQTSFENSNLSSYDPYTTRQNNQASYGNMNTLTKETMNMMDSSRLTSITRWRTKAKKQPGNTGSSEPSKPNEGSQEQNEKSADEEVSSHKDENEKKEEKPQEELSKSGVVATAKPLIQGSPYFHDEDVTPSTLIIVV